MKLYNLFQGFPVVFLVVVILADCAIINNIVQNKQIIKSSQDLSGDGRFILGWEIISDQFILFDVTVETTGFVGLGISTSGSMSGADMVMGGILPETGAVYFEDRFGVGYTEPIIDDHQDWFLVGASENSTHTSLKFYRLINTGDTVQDVIITANTWVIWAIGSSDAPDYHFRNRGSVFMNLLAPSI